MEDRIFLLSSILYFYFFISKSVYTLFHSFFFLPLILHVLSFRKWRSKAHILICKVRTLGSHLPHRPVAHKNGTSELTRRTSHWWSVTGSIQWWSHNLWPRISHTAAARSDRGQQNIPEPHWNINNSFLWMYMYVVTGQWIHLRGRMFLPVGVEVRRVKHRPRGIDHWRMVSRSSQARQATWFLFDQTKTLCREDNYR